MKIPAAAANVLNAPLVPPTPQPVMPAVPLPPIATQCFMLSNMFDPNWLVFRHCHHHLLFDWLRRILWR